VAIRVFTTWQNANLTWINANSFWDGGRLTRDIRDNIVAVSSLDNSKIYLVNAPEQVTAPYIVINQISGPRNYTLDGYDYTRMSRVQVDIYAKSYPTAKSEANNVYDLQITNSFKAVEIENEFDEYDDTLQLFRVSIDFIVYKED